MSRYSFRYLTLEGDLSSAWVEAESLEDAKRELLSEYWDVKEILTVQKI